MRPTLVLAFNCSRTRMLSVLSVLSLVTSVHGYVVTVGRATGQPRSAAPTAVAGGGAGASTALPGLLGRLTSTKAIELNRELAQLALAQDPRVVVRRSLDLARALQTVGQETQSGFRIGQQPTPAALLRRICEELGATYVKLGQFIASSPTLFPPEFVQEFQSTLDSTPPMAWSVVKPLIEKELGRPIESVYATVETEPLAAASIAQVHAAKLLTGEDVVLKVQKQGVEGSLKADLDLLYGVTRVLELLGVGTAELSEIVGTLRGSILEEIDFVLEAERTEQVHPDRTANCTLTGRPTAP